MKYSKTWIIFYLFSFALQKTSLQASQDELQHFEVFTKEVDTLEKGFDFLRQTDKNIPTFDNFMRKKIEEGQDYISGCLQAKDILVHGLKDRFIQNIHTNYALYRNISGPEGQIQNSAVEFVKVHGIKGWMEEDIARQRIGRQTQTNHISEQDRQEFEKGLKTLEIGFNLLRQRGEVIPPFKIFLEQHISQGETMYTVLFQAKYLIVYGLKDYLMNVISQNRTLYGNVYGPNGQIQDPVIEYIQDRGIASWFEAPVNLQPQLVQFLDEENNGQLYQVKPFDDWWTPSYGGVLGYQTNDSNNIGDRGDYSDLDLDLDSD